MQELPKQPLYRVTFHQQHVWEGYTGSPEDTVDVEIYQAWLKPATKAQLEQQQQHQQQHDHHAHQHSHDDGHHGVGDQHGDPQAVDHGHHVHEHGHPGTGEQHGDPQAVHHGDHVHEGRTVVEQNAVDLEGQDDAERRRLSEALIQVLSKLNFI